MRDLFEYSPAAGVIVIIVILSLALITLDSLMGVPEQLQGTVLEKHYVPERSSTGTGVGSAGGKTAVVITSEHDPEKFLVMVRTPAGKIETVKCSPELYYQKEVGDQLQFRIKRGRFTGSKWSVKGLR
jgi:hypothetical protein